MNTEGKRVFTRGGLIMQLNVAQKLIKDHLVSGEMSPGESIGLKIDQTLTQDATGTLVMLELEAMGIDKVKTDVSAQYVDHNLIQEDYRNPDDHIFLRSAAKKFGIHYSMPGNGVSHPVHMQKFAKPGSTLLGSDSHTCANGCMGMLAMGAGGIDVTLAMTGEPYYINMPKIMGVELTGKLNDWVSAKDVILEMLRRHSVKGGVGKIIEYYGDGLKELSAMDRHVIANMGAELGATATVFPSDDEVKHFLKTEGRVEDWTDIIADEGAEYDEHETIDLSILEPLIARPTSPDNVVPVKEIAGETIYQSYIGSSANPGYNDFAIASEIVKGKQIAPETSLDINPTSRQMLQQLVQNGHIANLLSAGARLHQAGCNGCIGMGQAPATEQNSLRTTPRNFPGRSGTKEDSVFLCSPETAAASILNGVITDPRTLDIEYPAIPDPEPIIDEMMIETPPEDNSDVEIKKGPNISDIPNFKAIEDHFEVPVLLKVGDNLSTDEILAGGSRVLPFRSNIEKISRFAFEDVDDTYHDKALEIKEKSGHMIVGGFNYGQGSSREHAALAPRFLGLKVVLVKDFARIHLQNLINFGILPITFVNEGDYDLIKEGTVLEFNNMKQNILEGDRFEITVKETGDQIKVKHSMTDRHKEILLAGGIINWIKERL